MTISELKSRLSHYLRRVRRGEKIMVCDRDTVIARIEPDGGAVVPADDDARWLADLERRGVVRRASRTLDAGWPRRRPAVGVDVVEALLGERRDSR